MKNGLSQQKLAVQSGHWPLFRFDPRRAAQGKNPMQLDSKAPSVPLEDYIYNETRYTMLRQSHPEEAKSCWKRPGRTWPSAGKCMKLGRAWA